MPKVTLYNTAGAAAGEIELNDSVFGVEYNEAVIHRQWCVRWQTNASAPMPQRPEALYAAAAGNPGSRKAQAVPESDLSAPHCG